MSEEWSEELANQHELIMIGIVYALSTDSLVRYYNLLNFIVVGFGVSCGAVL